MTETRPWPLAVYSRTLPALTPADAAPLLHAAGYAGLLLHVQSASANPSSQSDHSASHRSQSHHNARCAVEPTERAVTEAADVCARAGISITGLAFESDPLEPADIARAVELTLAAQ